MILLDKKVAMRLEFILAHVVAASIAYTDLGYSGLKDMHAFGNKQEGGQRIPLVYTC